MNEKELKELLLKKDEVFKGTYKQHKQLEKRLEKLKQKDFLTEVENMEVKELKKKKLFLKDKMYYLMTEYRKAHK